MGRAQEVQAENVTVLEGGTAEITCHLHQYDGSIVVIQNPARQTLFFNGTRALKDERFQLVEFSRRRLRLRLARARLEDEGGYFCQLYADDTHHQIATLTVLGRDTGRGKVFRQRNVLRLRVERRDHGAIVTCEATSPALPRGQRRQTQYMLDVHPTEISWSRGNESLPPRAVARGEVLTLPALGPQDNGTYSCQAHNPHGRAADHYVLVVYGEPPTATHGCPIAPPPDLPGSTQCRRCLITFPDAAFAARHAKRQHPRDFAAAALRGALFVCFVCARPFPSSPALLRH
ncbi:PREDICTED: cell adhesion molecule 4-like, partial [Calidris pugnax]|uniref:cell adhesion molecule 4-like n=1 Tax=Calidris pugnax TaxID=198806 RepID=UPI00071DB2D8